MKWTDSIVSQLESQVKASINQNAHEMEGQAKMLAPVDTGNLRRSIHTELKDGGMIAEVGTNISYAPFVEFGTSRQSAQPYMNPAFVRTSKTFESDINKIVRSLK